MTRASTPRSRAAGFRWRGSAAIASTLAVAAVACSRAPEPGAAPGAFASNSSSSPAPTSRVELAVYAATSTRDALGALEPVYERDHPVDLVFNFGGSGDLAKQIVAAAKADVFLSAGAKEMDEVEAARLVAPGTRRDLLANQLVVIEPIGDASVFRAPFAPAQLAQAAVTRLSLANTETVPAGRYARAWLAQVGVWPAVEARVLPGVDVRAALAAVESGGATAGIVYRTDVARSTKARIVHAVPLAEGPRVVYPLAVMSGRPREAEARAFAGFLTTDTARAAFEAAGFLVPEPAGAPR